ncbi:cobalt transporter [Actinoplanes sp. NPDC048988]|uniref:HoxN/HupN/NixA family nickel/cobalt transporter n=1 Tax=Actinoplanes sp. NPDC048988 TaxID=3363901 RepID=UPI003720920A
MIDASVLSDRMQDLIHTPGVTPLAFLIAFLAGAGHAVAPGHGKTLAAAYLAGSKGRIRDAAWLGGSVAAMHTFSVLVIGIAWTFLSLSDFVRMEQLTTWLQVAAGALIVATGIWMLRRHLRGHHHHHGHSHSPSQGHSHFPSLSPSQDHSHFPSLSPSQDHSHSPSEGHSHGLSQDHSAGTPHGLDHGHSADTPQDHPHSHDHSRRPGLLLLGISGGLTPSPAAFLVLATGLFLGRAGFALLLVLTFGAGMAVVLFGVGVLAVAGSSLITRSSRSFALLTRATRVTPILAAAGITLFGAGLVTIAAVHLTTVA